MSKSIREEILELKVEIIESIEHDKHGIYNKMQIIQNEVHALKAEIASIKTLKGYVETRFGTLWKIASVIMSIGVGMFYLMWGEVKELEKAVALYREDQVVQHDK